LSTAFQRLSDALALSNGPKTDEGKARSSQNATKHGLRSRDFVVLPQDQPEFEELRDSLLDEIRPQGGINRTDPEASSSVARAGKVSHVGSC
jgi:hypothetical protein